MFYYVFWRSYAGSRSKVFLIHETLLSSIAVLVLSGASIFLGFYFVFGNFKFFFESNSLMFCSIDCLREFFFNFFWSTPFLDASFFVFSDSFYFLHTYLPIIILSWILAVLSFSFFFLFFFKQAFNRNLINSAFYDVQTNSSSTTFSIFFRHFFNFFTKAWLFDIFIAKLARVFFLLGRIFIQRFIENGLFEYILVLYPVRKLNLIGALLLTEGSMSGRLSVYLFNILLGGLFVFAIFLCLVVGSLLTVV
jgi:hypothetical protein